MKAMASRREVLGSSAALADPATAAAQTVGVKAGDLPVADNTGGISGSMRVGLLADAFGLECTPHKGGNPLDLAVHFHLEFALPNAFWFEVPYPPELVDHPYMPIKYRPDKEGSIHAPTAPGLGVPIDRTAFDRATKQILR
jgi:L-alanine-DL-glutamate epimerase-like enolase superfamily enzyme